MVSVSYELFKEGMLTTEQTAFHASFTDNGQADEAVLQVSRGTSVVCNALGTLLAFDADVD